MKKFDRTGMRYGRLEVLGWAGHRGSRRTWKCRCDCGKIIVAAGHTLTGGYTKSCGCLKTETLKRIKTKHGMCRTKVYMIWSAMRSRCTNPKEVSFKYYGARGIACDPRWNDFRTFFADMGPKPNGKTLERIDNDGPYSSENCRWATRKEQANNRRCPIGLVHVCPACGHSYSREK